MTQNNIINFYNNINQNANYLSIKELHYNDSNIPFSNFQEPIVVRGLCQNTFAFKNWNIHNIPHFFGNQKVKVEYFRNTIDTYNCSVDKMYSFNFQEFLDNLDSKNLYMGEVDFDDFNKPDLYDQVFNSQIQNNSFSTVLFCGKNTGSSMHIHSSNDYILNQIIGQKTVFLFDFYDNSNNNLSFGNPCHPSHEIFLHDYNKNKSCDIRLINHNHLKIYKVVLQPGDSLLIPPWWWHNAFSDDFSCSITKKYPRSDFSYLFKYPQLLFYDICIFFHHSLIMKFFPSSFFDSYDYYFIIFTIFTLSFFFTIFKLLLISILFFNISNSLNFPYISFFHILFSVSIIFIFLNIFVF